MRVLVCAGAGFLLAVLWFDLMFDVQVRGHDGPELPTEVRDSIATYYRRVTTAARPMNRLVMVAMLVTLAALVGEIVLGDVQRWVAVTSLVFTATAVGIAAVRTVRNAVRLGAQADTAIVQSELARGIYRDHLVCLGTIAAVLLLQLIVA
jgi:hypothetical protein